MNPNPSTKPDSLWCRSVLLASLGLPLAAPQQGGLPTQSMGPAGDLATGVEIVVEGQAHPEFLLTWMLLPPELQIVDKTVMELGHEPEVEFALIHSCVIPGSWMPDFVSINKSQQDLEDPQIGPCHWLAQNPRPPQEEPRLSQGFRAFSLPLDPDGKLKPLHQPWVMGFQRCNQAPLLQITFRGPS